MGEATGDALLAPRRRCRSCGGGDLRGFLDLGAMPLANTLPTTVDVAEARHPLAVAVCGDCRLAQLTHDVPPTEIFADYPYFSSYSSSWLTHARSFAEHAAKRLGLGRDAMVIEVASNDGYLLRHFMALGVPVLGVEPSDTVAAAARAIGVPTDGRFFGTETARALRRDSGGADLIVANNVLAHVPDLNDFIAGLGVLLKPTGMVSCEFPHLARMIEGAQFDTIYHEHYSYFSVHSVERAFARHGLTIVDVEELPTHGGSLRIWAALDTAGRVVSPVVDALKERERTAGLEADGVYEAFAAMAEACVADLRGFLAGARADGRRVAGYGAAAKGATLLGACGVTAREIAFIADLNPHKRGRFLPGTGIPIVAPERIFAERPDHVVILPWNLQEEIIAQLAGVRDWGGNFVIPAPKVRVIP